MAPQKGSQRKRGSCAVRERGKPSGYAETYLGCDCPGCEISPKPHTVTGLALRAEAADTRDSVPLKHEMNRVSILSVQPLSPRLQSNSRCSVRQRNNLYKFCETGTGNVGSLVLLDILQINSLGAINTVSCFDPDQIHHSGDADAGVTA